MMKSKIVTAERGSRTTILVLDPGEEALATLTRFATETAIAGASFTAIGAFENAVVGWFDLGSKSYKQIRVGEQCEVLSAVGDIATGDDGKASLHVHVVLGLSDGTTRGGHLLEGKVRPTLEVVLEETPAGLRRRKQPDLGIALIDLAAKP